MRSTQRATTRRALCLVAILFAGCHRRAGTYPNADVVLVSIDTLRADRLSIYGNARAATPNLAALARESVVFDEVLSHYPLTLPAHASMLTGLLPQHHGVRSNGGFVLSPSHPTLATRLEKAGWATGAAVSSAVLARQTGIAEGFDFYEDAIGGSAPEAFNAAQRDGAITLQALTGWIDGRPKEARLFAFLHLYEPHSPYEPPARYAHVGDGPYDGEVAYADELVGRLVDDLKKSGRWDRTILVVTGDHGESLGEHGEPEHGILLYRSTLHVPLLVRLPGGVRGGTRVAGLAAQDDIVPTLLDLAGVPADGLDGRSLRAALDGRALDTRPVYSETLYPRYAFGWSQMRALSDERYRFIEAPRPELFDVRADPGEAHPLDAGASTGQAMRRSLQVMDPAPAVPTPVRMPADQAERLRALGYVQGAEAAVTASSLPDPKDRIAIYPRMKTALGDYQKHRWVEASAELREVLRSEPRMVSLYGILGEALARQGRGDDALAAWKEGLAQEPGRPGLGLAVARELVRRGEIEAALPYAQAAAGDTPAGGAEVLAKLLLAEGKMGDAERFARRALARDENLVLAHYVLGAAQHRARRYEEALASFRAALSAKPPGLVVTKLHANIGDCLARLGRNDEAEAEFQAEIDGNPAGPDAFLGLALLRRAKGQDAEASRTLERWLLAVPHPAADHYWLLIRMFLFMNDQGSAQDWSRIAHGAFPSDPRFRGGVPASPAPVASP